MLRYVHSDVDESFLSQMDVELFQVVKNNFYVYWEISF